MRWLLAVLVVLVASVATPAVAQDDEAAGAVARIVAPPPPDGGPSHATLTVMPPDPAGEARAERFATLRLSHRAGRETEGFGLMIYGLASIVLGGVVAGVGYQDERVLGFGVGTMLWGALNAAFSPIFFDLDGSTQRRIEQGRSLRGDALEREREDWAADQYRNAAGIAVNVGLDVFYAVTGALLSVIGYLLAPEQRWLEGYGVAMGAQGLGLLAFDLTTWMTAEARGEATRTLFRDEDAE